MIVINLKMTFSELILTLPPDTKSLIRSIEKTNRKIINIQLSLVFNKICIQENLLPAYSNIYICIKKCANSGTLKICIKSVPL